MKTICAEYKYFYYIDVPDDATPQEIEKIIDNYAPAPGYIGIEYGPEETMIEEE